MGKAAARAVIVTPRCCRSSAPKTSEGTRWPTVKAEKRTLALQHRNHKEEEAREASARAKEKLKHAKKKLKAARAMMSMGGKKGMAGMFGGGKK